MSRSYATDSQDYDRRDLAERVATIIEAVRRRGDDALRELESRARGFAPDELRVSERQIERCFARIPQDALDDVRFVLDEARAFAEVQRTAIRNVEVDSHAGVRYGLRHVPLPAAGVCGAGASGLTPPPGLTGVATAVAAGVPRIVACAALNDGCLPALSIAALRLAGADEIYAVDGVQAVAALALGTESIERVDVVVGSGDAAMGEANRQLFGGRAVELDATHHEMLIIADETASAEIVAADVLAVIDGDPDARAVVITADPGLAARVAGAVEQQLDEHPSRTFAATAWERHGAVNVVSSREEACALADRYALHHVEVLTAEPHWYLGRLRRCATVLLGHDTAPGLVNGIRAHTAGGQSVARGSGLSVTSFLNTVAYHECLEPETTRLASEVFARQRRLSGLEAYARAAELRVAEAAAAKTDDTHVELLPAG